MIVYKNYDQQQLNRQYDNRFHVPEYKNYLDDWENRSRMAERECQLIKGVRYGEDQREFLDIFPSAQKKSKTLIFIHGGYWQRFDTSLFYFVAAAFGRYDITTVLVNYPLAPAASMDSIVQANLNAIRQISSNMLSWNGDADQLFITGHSAGAQLATMAMTVNNPVSIHGVCCLSGLFNLWPIQLSNLNEVLKMDDEMAIRNSPALNKPVNPASLLLAVGQQETDEFKQQAQELFTRWKDIHPELLLLPGLNHFSILDSFCDADSLLHQSMCKLMQL